MLLENVCNTSAYEDTVVQISDHTIAYHIIGPFISISHSIAYEPYSNTFISYSISLKLHITACHNMHEFTVLCFLMTFHDMAMICYEMLMR